MTKDANRVPDGARPDVFYMATIHARVDFDRGQPADPSPLRRQLRHEPRVTNLVDTRELWFVLVSNPDGYQHTFDVERLWRKNLRDNNGDGQITVGDGVDNNRNYDEKWNYDNEGSSSVQSADDYRGPDAASEPETTAIQNLLERLRFRFMITYHSYGELLLYMWGFQVQTPTADDPIYVALSGTDANPAIPGYNPGVGADLYITNGTTDDYAHAVNTLGWTPELSEGCDGCGFVFPDDEALIQAEYLKNLPFAVDVAKSAPNPAQPVSHLGNTTNPSTWMSAIDPEKTNNPLSDFRFSVSYGDPQPVQVLARRNLGAVTLKYRINGAPNGSLDVRMERRRAVRRHWRRPLPDHARERHRHESRRRRHGVVRGRGRHGRERLVHLYRGGRVVEPRARPRGRGLHGHLARLQEEHRAQLPVVLPRRPRRERDRRRRLRRGRQRPHGAEPTRRARPL